MKRKFATACRIIIFTLALVIAFNTGVLVGDKITASTVIYKVVYVVYQEIPETAQETSGTVNEPYFYLTDSERQIAECMVMGEAGSESYYGQTLVAYCILNACEKDDLQPSEVRRVYKYSGWHEKPSESVKNAVKQVFEDGYKPVDDTPLWFYAPKWCNSAWHEEQRFIIEVGDHRFFGEV